MSKTYEWAIVADGGVSDRFATEAEALAALPEYPQGSRVEFDPFEGEAK